MKKKITYLLVFLSIFFVLFLFTSCAPISNEEDAKELSNVIIKSYMAGDTSRISVKDRTIHVNNSGIYSSNFSSSRFYSIINPGFTFSSIDYDNVSIDENGKTYTLNGTLYFAVDTTYANPIIMKLICYGNIEVTKNGQIEDVSFDGKWEISFQSTDPDNDGIYEFSMQGNVEAYVNDIHFLDNAWSIEFSGELLILN